jgi:hypothetical protein
MIECNIWIERPSAIEITLTRLEKCVRKTCRWIDRIAMQGAASRGTIERDLLVSGNHQQRPLFSATTFLSAGNITHTPCYGHLIALGMLCSVHGNAQAAI